MKHGYGIRRAENLMNSMEDSQGRSLFGTGEKELVCNYAYHIEAFSKLKALAETLAQSRFELRRGYIDPEVSQRVNREIDRVEEIWQHQDETGILEYLPIPFSDFEDGDLTGAEYLLETGEKLRLSPPSLEYYVSENRLADGTLTTPHIYRGVNFDGQGQPLAFRQEDGVQLENPHQAVEPEIGIQQTGVSYGLITQRTEPGFILENGAVLLASERDAYGNYLGGAGAGGMLIKTGKRYAPVLGDDGQPRAFRELKPVEYRFQDGKWQAPDNYLKTAEMGTEENYNQIDGIINNRPPCPSVLENLKQHREAAAAQGRDTGQPHKPHQGPER